MPQETDIYAVLQRRLTRNGFVHGAKLRPEDLRAEFGCSTSTVREVLFRLSTVGLVDYLEQRGFRVPERCPKKLIELTNVRILIEGEGAVLSIRKGGIDWEARLSAAHHKLIHIERRINGQSDHEGLTDIWANCENEFHQTLISACDSEILQQLHRQIYAQFRQQLMVADIKFDYLAGNIEHHAAILDAALKGDEALIRQRIHEHLERHLGGDTLGD